MKFTFDRFLNEKANVLRETLDPVERIEVVDRYTVKFVLKEPFVWLLNRLAARVACGSSPPKWWRSLGT